MNIGQLDGQPLALQIFNGMTAESTCVNERWAKDQLFRCVCFAGGRHQTILDETVGPIFQSPSSVWRTTSAACPNSCYTLFQSTSSVWRTTAKTEKNLYLHSYNTAICTNLQPKHSAYAFVCTDKDKQSHEKLVRSIRLRGDRSMFARPLSPDGALRKSARHPDGRRGELRCVQPCFDNGCPTGKSAGCPLPGRSVWSARP